MPPYQAGVTIPMAGAPNAALESSVPARGARLQSDFPQGALLPATLGASLVLALALNLAACVQLAAGTSVVPFTEDEALIHLELWGVRVDDGAGCIRTRVPEVPAAPADPRRVATACARVVGARKHRDASCVGSAAGCSSRAPGYLPGAAPGRLTVRVRTAPL
jgi:hypothetical protein